MNGNWTKKSSPPTVTVNGAPVLRLAGVAMLIFVAILVFSTATYIVPPGKRGVRVTLGRVAPEPLKEGFGLKQPFISAIHLISVRQETRSMPAACYSSDLQQVKMEIRALYRIPEKSVVTIYQQYAGAPFDNLIAPRIQEAIKEVAATQSAEQIVKNREQVKLAALELARKKIGTNFLELTDVVLYNLSLSPELEQAIELKMVQEQDAAKAKFTQLKAQIEADTAIIRAKGEAEAIGLRGEALRANPAFIKLEMVQNWNGRSPMVVGSEGAGNLLLQAPQTPPAAPTVRQRSTDGGPQRPASPQAQPRHPR
jgi:prohibitin 2